MLDCGFQSQGFRIPQAKNSWIPESGFPYMGRGYLWNIVKTATGRFHDDNVHLTTITRIHFGFAFLLKFVNPAEVLTTI